MVLSEKVRTAEMKKKGKVTKESVTEEMKENKLKANNRNNNSILIINANSEQKKQMKAITKKKIWRSKLC